MNLKSVRTGAWITVSGALVVALLSGVAYTQGPATLVQIMTGGAIVSTSNRLPVDATGTGGGAVTIADGADVAQGTTTDAACATDNGICTVEALLKRIAQRVTSLITALGSPFQAGGSIGNTAFNTSSATAPVSTMNSASAGAGVNAAAACVFDDVAPTGLTENNFGFVRCSTNRNQYMTLRDAAGNERGMNVNASNQGSVSIDGTNTPVIGAGTANIGNVGGTSNVTPTDCSGTIATGGTAQNAFTAQAALRGFTIQNLSTDPMWISFTGTAVVGAVASYLLPAGSTTIQGGSYSSPFGFGMNTALSVIAATTSDKYSCTRW